MPQERDYPLDDAHRGETPPSGEPAAPNVDDDIIPLEEPDSASDASRRPAPQRPSDEEPESCPSCGGGMKPDQLVCLRCGFNLRDLKTAKTKIIAPPRAEREDDDDEEESASPGDTRPLVRISAVDPWLPASIAIISVLILLIGYLAGTYGLYPHIAADAIAAQEAGRQLPTVSFLDRVLAVAQFFVMALLLTGCGLAGLFLLAQMLNRAFGDLSIAALRMAAIVTAMRLVTFTNLASPRIELLLEIPLQGAVFFTLTLLLFRLSPRNAGIVAVAGLLAFLMLWLSASAILWATS